MEIKLRKNKGDRSRADLRVGFGDSFSFPLGGWIWNRKGAEMGSEGLRALGLCEHPIPEAPRGFPKLPLSP